MSDFWPHHHSGPWRDAPPWAIELREMLRIVINNQGASMSQVDDLVAAVATLTGNVAAHDTAVQAEIAALVAAVANSNAASDPAIAAAIKNISDASSTLATETAALAASVKPPVVISPTPPAPTA